MNKKGLKLALTALLAVSQAFALSEMRTPWVASNGPLRYVFESNDKEGKYDLNLWSAAHTKYANRAFLKHGFKAQELSALIFNKADFKLAEAFADGAADGSNPLASFKSLSPRVEYNETGMTLGGEISMPVWKNKGKLGLRASVPLRSVELERLDSGLDKAEDPLADYVVAKVMKASADGNTTTDRISNGADVLVKAYRLDMLKALKDPNNANIFAASIPASNNGLYVLGSPLGGATANNAAAGTNFAAIMPDSAVTPGRPVNVGYVLIQDAGLAARTGAGAGAEYKLNECPSLNANFDNFPGQNRIVNIATNNDYRVAFAGLSADQAAKLWLVFRRTADSTDAQRFGAGTAGRGIGDGLDTFLAQFNENAFVYLSKHGISLDGQVRTGLGDIDVDAFYSHALNEDWDAELVLGVRLPTGGDKDKFGNPYKSMLGNGGHWELKAGAVLAWEAMHWMNLKADASYSFVLESTENRMGVFAGSTVKNMGPKAAADVDWGYFKGKVDATFFHPKTRDIRSVLGYELYYKLEDRLSYKSKQVAALDGGPKNLDAKLAVKNTEAIGHKVRFETSYQVSRYFEFFAGGSFTFAGQNVARDRDTHGGFNIRF